MVVLTSRQIILPYYRYLRMNLVHLFENTIDRRGIFANRSQTLTLSLTLILTLTLNLIQKHNNAFGLD